MYIIYIFFLCFLLLSFFSSSLSNRISRFFKFRISLVHCYCAIQPIIFEIRVFGVPQRHLLYRACFDKFRVSVVSTVKSRHRYKLRKKIIYFDQGREKIYFVR